MNTLFTVLTSGDYNYNEEREVILGEEIADTFMNGNFTSGVNALRKINVSATEFSDFLINQAEDMGMELKDLWGGHFGNNFWIALGSELEV